jgi:hypothetical protein
MRTLLEIAGRRPVPELAEDAVQFAPTAPVAERSGAGNGDGNGNGAAPVTSDDLRSLLTLAGSRPVPEPDASFLAETEARILGLDRDNDRPVVAVPLGDDSRDELSVRRARKVRRPALLTGAAAAVVVLVIVGALTGLYGGGGGGGKGGSDLALVTAVDTVVILPDGTRIEGARGVELPDGTIIRTGPRGRATIAGVHLGPDSEAVIRDGRVLVVGDDTSELPAGGGTGTEVVPPPTAPTDGSSTGGSSGGSGGTTGGSGSTSGDNTGGETPTSAPPPPPTLLPPIVVPSLPVPTLPLPTLPPLEDLLPLG